MQARKFNANKNRENERNNLHIFTCFYRSSRFMLNYFDGNFKAKKERCTNNNAYRRHLQSRSPTLSFIADTFFIHIIEAFLRPSRQTLAFFLYRSPQKRKKSNSNRSGTESGVSTGTTTDKPTERTTQ